MTERPSSASELQLKLKHVKCPRTVSNHSCCVRVGIIQNQIGGCKTKICMDDLYVLSSFSTKTTMSVPRNLFRRNNIHQNDIWGHTKDPHVHKCDFCPCLIHLILPQKSSERIPPINIWGKRPPKGRERGFKIIEEEKRWSNNKPLRGLACAFAGVRGWLAGII